MLGRSDQGHDERGLARGQRIVGTGPWPASHPRAHERARAARLGRGREIGRLPALPGARGQAQHATRALGAQPVRLRRGD